MSHLWTASVLHGPSESLHQYPPAWHAGPNPSPTATTAAAISFLSREPSASISPAFTGVPPQVIATATRCRSFLRMPMTCCVSCPASTSAPSRSNARFTRSARNASTNGTKPLSVSSSCPWPRSSPCPKALPLPRWPLRQDDRRRTLLSGFLPDPRTPTLSARSTLRRRVRPCGPGDHPSYGSHPGRDVRKKRRKRRTGVRIRSACC